MVNQPLIFIIEDNPTNLRLVYDLLTAHGFYVSYSSGVGDVVDLIMDQKPDLILMDISLKDQSGLDLTRKLKDNPFTAQIPVVALTAHTTEQDKANALAAGCIGFIPKPINTRKFPFRILQLIKDIRDEKT